MAWSTRQLADLAGTTVKAVRHYHATGLLEDPVRTANGYKQYQIPHLVRLLQIRRLIDLGLPLAQIATMGRADEDPDEAIRVLDAELEVTIERLQRVRAELAIILRHRAAVDLPEGFGPVAGEVSAADRGMLLIYSRILNDEAMAELRDVMQVRDPVDDEFDALAPDADEDTIQALAERMAPGIRRLQEQYPAMRDIVGYTTGSQQAARSTVVEAVLELYNPAQVEALRRATLILQATEAEDA
jgi:DNA-binding transcriptional MerR regulator